MRSRTEQAGQVRAARPRSPIVALAAGAWLACGAPSPARADALQKIVDYSTSGTVGSAGVTGAGVVSFNGLTRGALGVPSKFSLGQFQVLGLTPGKSTSYDKTPFHITLLADGTKPVIFDGVLNGRIDSDGRSTLKAQFTDIQPVSPAVAPPSGSTSGSTTSPSGSTSGSTTSTSGSTSGTTGSTSSTTGPIGGATGSITGATGGTISTTDPSLLLQMTGLSQPLSLTLPSTSQDLGPVMPGGGSGLTTVAAQVKVAGGAVATDGPRTAPIATATAINVMTVTPPPQIAAVPEPTASALAAMVLAGLGLGRLCPRRRETTSLAPVQ